MHSRTSLYEPSYQRPSISSRPLFHIADAGFSMTDHRGRKRNHAARNAAMGQEIADENEKRDRHDLELSMPVNSSNPPETASPAAKCARSWHTACTLRRQN